MQTLFKLKVASHIEIQQFSPKNDKREIVTI